MEDKRLIEHSFPVKEVSREGAREKTLGTGISRHFISGGQGVLFLQAEQLPFLL